MCAVIFFGWLTAPALALAAGGQVETRIATTTSSGQAFVGPQSNSGPAVANQSSVLSFRTPALLKSHVVISGSMTNTKNDYSNVQLTNVYGDKSVLSSTFNKAETSAEIGIELKDGPHTANFTLAQMLSESPYSFSAYSIGYNRSFYTNTSALGLDYSWSRQLFPRNYFDDPSDNYHTKARPDALTAYRGVIWYEQVLSSRAKGQVRFLSGQREDRPPHVGVEFRNSYALLDSLFSRLDFGFLSERRGEPLRNERGYLAVSWLEAQISYEPFYDFLVTLSAGTTVEREDVPWDRDANGVSKKTQFAADIYGLRLGYKGKKWSANLQGQTATSNTTYRANTYSGNLVWEL